MLRWFARLSIRWKLATVTIVTTAVSLLLAGAIMAAYDARTYERQKVESTTAQADLLSASIAASLVFNDRDATHEYLSALNVNREIDAAAAYDAGDNLVAKYERPNVHIRPVPEIAEPRGYHFDGEHLTVFVPVIDHNARLGSVYLSASVEPVSTRLARYVASLVVIASAALAVILPIALRLQRIITNPIAELATKNAIIETTLEAVDHGVIVVDSELRVSFLNERAYVMLNIPRHKLRVGMNLEAFMRAWEAEFGLPIQETGYKRLYATEKLRKEFVLPGGRVIEFRQSPLPQGGFVRTYTDISEQRVLQEKLQQAKEKAEEAATAKSKFLAAMSHEIRTPMNGVVGIVELLKSTRLSDEQKQMVEIIQRSGITLLDVINDILDYSKIEAGRMTLETTAFSLADVVETTAEISTAHAQSKALDISCTVDPDIDEILQGDPVRVRQVILNMMGNAVKFTEKGAVGIEVTADTITDDRIVVLFEITDSGIGISLKKQKALFQAFQQADYSTTRRYGGTGLGLSICKNLVELMGGEIGVSSIEGKGSTFWFKIPFERLQRSEPTSMFSHHQRHLSGLRVLVHDSIQSRSAISLYLRAIGIDAIESKGIAELFDTLRRARASERPIHIVIVRFQIGDDRAHTFYEELDRHPYLDDTKFIFVVPHLNASAARVATKEGVSWSISAPIRRAKFYDLIARVTGRISRKVKMEEDAADLNFIPPTIDEARSAGCLVLVAEDNETNQFVIKSQLQRLGIAAEFVNDGREAWDNLSREEDRYGLVITDCHMPFIDGYQLTGLIRDQELTTKRRRLPVVALTANALQGESDICRAAGMDDYLFKPSSLEALDIVLNKWLPKAIKLRRPQAPSSTGSAPVHSVRNTTPVKKNGAANPPIDIATLAGVLAKYNPEYPRKILEVFRTTESQTAAKLRELVRTQNATALRAAAHGAKGSAASAYAGKLAGLCAELERSAEQPDWIAIDVLTAKIENEFEEVLSFIENLE
ncbi:MAG: response regulator [Rhodospirillaceae bacterium]|nr:MAG: response regulator [Rhodospirillaceae bacterium]